MPLLIPLGVVGSTKLEPSPYWISIGDQAGDSVAWLSAVDSQGNSYTAGEWYAFGTPSGLVTKRDPLGEIVWEQSPFNERFGPRSMVLSPDEQELVIGATLEDYSFTYEMAAAQRLTTSSGGGFTPTTLTSNPFDTFDVDEPRVDVDSSGNVYMVAMVSPNPSTTELFSVVAKANSAGTVQWIKKIDDGRYATFFARSVRVDRSNGDIYIAGETRDGFTVSAGVALKINSSGSLIWAKELYDSAGYVRITGGALDSSNNLYLVGYQGETVQVINKLDSSGNLLWQKQISSGYVQSATTDSNDNLIITMYVGYAYVDLLKFDPSGNLLWQRRVSGMGEGLYNLQPSTSSDDDIFVPASRIGPNGDAANALIKLPGNGSILGTFGPITISSSSRSVSSYSRAWTNASHPLSNYSLSFSGQTVAFTSPNLTYERINIR